MATGRLASVNPPAAAGNSVYTVPVSNYSAVSISILNRSSSPTTYRLAILENGVSTPTFSNYLEYDVVLDGENFVERTGLVLSAGQSIWVYSPTSSLAINVYGYETQAS
jgi:hypothetical protein